MPVIVTAAGQSDLFATGATLRYGAFARHYYPIAFASQREDASFAVIEGDVPVLLVLATVGDGRLDYYGSPLKLFGVETCGEAAIAAAFSHIDGLIETHGVERVGIADLPSVTLSPVGEACLNRRLRPSLQMTAWADLSEGEVSLRRGLRKSYKSLLNWGKANMTISVVNREAPDRAQFDRYQAFHHEVAGRAARVQETWDALYSWIESGRGELVLGFLQSGELVSGNLVGDAEGSAYYLSGVYDRERFDKPMAHWPLWTAMLRAHERGFSRFELGDVPLDGAASPKEVAIGFFKRGFATDIATTLVWAKEPG